MTDRWEDLPEREPDWSKPETRRRWVEAAESAQARGLNLASVPTAQLVALLRRVDLVEDVARVLSGGAPR